MRKWIIGLALLLVLLLGSLFGFDAFKRQMIAKHLGNRPPQALPVATATAEPQTWQPALQAIGTIEPSQGVDVSNSVSGLVSAIHFNSGQKVAKGQLLVELDAAVEMAQLKSAEARLPAVRAQLSRVKSLIGKGTATQRELDNAQADYRELTSNIESLKATIDRRKIRAPFSGDVGIRRIHLGQYLQPGSVISRLESIEFMRIQLYLPQKEFSRIQVDTPIEARVDTYPERQFAGRIIAVEPTVDTNSGVFQVLAELPNADGLLRSGMFAQVDVLLPPLEDQLVIPDTAIDYTLYGEYVYRLYEKENQRGEKRLKLEHLAIEIAEQREGQVRITQGLNPGDRVVTSGHVRLYNGAPVKVVDDPTLQARSLPLN